MIIYISFIPCTVADRYASHTKVADRYADVNVYFVKL